VARIGLVGGSYTSQSRNADDSLCMNWYPEAIENPSGKVASALYPTPGLQQFVALPDTPVRGQITTNGRAFAVGGASFCEVLSNGTTANVNVIANDSLPISMAAGTTQILIASAGLCYVFDMTTNTMTAIPAGTLTGVSQVGYCDGFFLAFLVNSHTFQASALLDATNWPGASIGSTNVFVDNGLAMLVDHREVWLFGLSRSVVYYDSGNSPFPFDVVPGGMIEQGIVAGNSPVRLDNSVFWLGGDERGNGVAWRAQGYTPARVSNHAVEFAWQGYSTISDAVGYSYQDQGHSFWVLYFPTAQKTWVYDVATGQWHERGHWNVANGTFTAHTSQNHMMAFGKHLVGDWSSGKIYQMSIAFYADGESPIRRVRRCPHVSTEQEWIFHHQLQVDLETGLGPQPPLLSPPTYQGTEIQCPAQVGVVSAFEFTAGVSVLGDPYHFSIVVINNGPSPVTVGYGLISMGFPIVINPGSSAIVSQTIVGDGINQAFIEISPRPLTNMAIDVICSNPQIIDTFTGVNQIPVASQDFSTGWTSTTAPTVITQNLGASPRDPEINLRWSDDGGHTWSNIYAVGAGQAGNFKTRAIWRRLGRSRDRVYEVSVSDPIPWRLLEADLLASPGFTPSERISKQYQKVT
jgi:hypothetical protein